MKLQVLDSRNWPQPCQLWSRTILFAPLLRCRRLIWILNFLLRLFVVRRYHPPRYAYYAYTVHIVAAMYIYWTLLLTEVEKVLLRRWIHYLQRCVCVECAVCMHACDLSIIYYWIFEYNCRRDTLTWPHLIKGRPAWVQSTCWCSHLWIQVV